MERVLISIGSNLFNPFYQIKKSLCVIANDYPDIKFIACSSYYRSRPLGCIQQPDFLNVVAIIDTNLSPIDFLNCMQFIEVKQGRIRRNGFRWGPRTLDIDILLFGNRLICSQRLIIPHYDMYNRTFVLYPLFELMPNFFFNGNRLSKYLDRLPKNNLQRLDIK